MQSFCKNLSISVVLVAGHMVQVSGQQPTPASGRIDFDRDIRPILSDKCFVCHGPDAANNKSKLRFDTEAHAFADLGMGGAPSCAAIRNRAIWCGASRPRIQRCACLRFTPGSKLTKQEIDRLTRMDRAGCAVAAALGIHPAQAATGAGSKEW